MSAIASAALSGIGAVVGAFGAIENAMYQSEVAAQQAQEQRIIANELEQQARAQTAAGQQAAAAQSQKAAATQNQAEAGFAANNITGKSRDEVVRSLGQEGQFEATNVLSSAEWQAYHTRAEEQSAGAQAGFDQAASEQASIAGPIGAFGSLVGGASVFSGKWASLGGGGFGTAGAPVPTATG
jgi:hypothetical protein